MKKYTAPKIEINEFNNENVLTGSGLFSTDSSGYTPSTEGEQFNSTSYILRWK